MHMVTTTNAALVLSITVGSEGVARIATVANKLTRIDVAVMRVNGAMLDVTEDHVVGAIPNLDVVAVVRLVADLTRNIIFRGDHLPRNGGVQRHAIAGIVDPTMIGVAGEVAIDVLVAGERERQNGFCREGEVDVDGGEEEGDEHEERGTHALCHIAIFLCKGAVLARRIPKLAYALVDTSAFC